tara:strand:+ start:789 stop:1166 length:378 start_codon:yes stop_codon:yes gene_type:complete
MIRLIFILCLFVTSCNKPYISNLYDYDCIIHETNDECPNIVSAQIEYYLSKKDKNLDTLLRELQIEYYLQTKTSIYEYPYLCLNRTQLISLANGTSKLKEEYINIITKCMNNINYGKKANESSSL